MRVCKYCGKEIDENNIYGKGLFCNKKCQLALASKKGNEVKKIKHKKNIEEKLKNHKCLNCGKQLQNIKTKFCNHSCSTQFNNKKRESFSEKTKQKISDSVKKYYKYKKDKEKRLNDCKKRFCNCGKNIGYFNKSGMCRECFNNSGKRKELGKISYQKVLAEGKFVGWKTRNITSYAEQFWQKVLDNNKISYTREFVVKYGKKANEHYFLDFLTVVSQRKNAGDSRTSSAAAWVIKSCEFS